MSTKLPPKLKASTKAIFIALSGGQKKTHRQITEETKNNEKSVYSALHSYIKKKWVKREDSDVGFHFSLTKMGQRIADNIDNIPTCAEYKLKKTEPETPPKQIPLMTEEFKTAMSDFSKLAKINNDLLSTIKQIRDNCNAILGDNA
jgi:hypothetical protein